MVAADGGRDRGADPLGWLDDALADLRAHDLHRELRHHAGPSGPWLDLEVDGEPRRVLHLSGNGYLGLADDPRLAAASARAATTFGTGAGASRLVTGGTVLHQALEQALAAWKGTQDALLFSSGYLANLGAVTALVGRGDAIVADERNHASLIDACRLSRADVHVFRHADVEHATALLRAAADAAPQARRLLVTDGVFSMDGDLAPLPDLCDAAEASGAMVLVDDAHGSGVLGQDGRGTAAMLGCEDRIDVTVVTLSKALASAGGAVLGSTRLVDWLRNRARVFVFDTALPAPSVAAALAALEVAAHEPWRREVALAHAATLAEHARALGLDVPATRSPIVPIVLGAPAAALTAMQALLDHDVLAIAIRPPSVPPGTSRLRLTTMGTHTDADLDHATAALTAALAPR